MVIDYQMRKVNTNLAVLLVMLKTTVFTLTGHFQLYVAHLDGSMLCRMDGRRATNNSAKCRVPHIPGASCLRFYTG